MQTCHKHYPWVLSVPFSTNCAYNGVILPVCANNSDCPGVCVVPKAGSTLFKTSMEAELSRLGTPMAYEPGCAAVHCAHFPWPAWPALPHFETHPGLSLSSYHFPLIAGAPMIS